MYDNSNKKMLIMLILRILQKYSDVNHRLTQPDIIMYLQEDYGMVCDRRSVKRNIMDLIALGYGVNTDNGYYLEERQFDVRELNQLVGATLFFATGNKAQNKRLLDKLKDFASEYEQPKVDLFTVVPYTLAFDVNKMQDNLRILNEALSKKKKVSFRYPLENGGNGQEALVINPYQILAVDGLIYLAGNINKCDQGELFRVDLAGDIRVLDERVRPASQVKGLDKALLLPKNRAERQHMSLTERIPVELKIPSADLKMVTDWFGSKVKLVSREEEEMIVSFTGSEEAVFRWAMTYGDKAEVVAPAAIREKIAACANAMAEKYRQ